MLTSGLVLGVLLAPAPARPNVVLILAEDLGRELGAAGDSVETPHLDAIARRGRLFTAAYVQEPTSVPSRFSILVGRSPQSTALEAEARRRLAGTPPLSERLAVEGYRTAHVGRSFGGAAEVLYRWTETVGQGSPGTELASLLTSGDPRPLLFVVGLDAGTIPKPYRDLYPPDRVAGAPDPAPPALPAIETSPARPMRAGLVASPVPLAADALRERVAMQRARTSWVDAQVGEILGALDRSGAAARTVVVVAGDSARDLVNRGALGRSDLLSEGALRTTLIVAGPGVASPGVPSGALVEMLDVYPTLAELARVPPPRDIEGRSLVPMLADPGRPGRDAALSVVARDAPELGYSVRTDRYRYNEWPDGTAELYDHASDPDEIHNLAGRGGAALDELRGLLQERLSGRDPGAPSEPTLASTATTTRPNVVLMVLDDLSVRLGCYGYPLLTPNIDRLAARGRRFDRAYVGVAMCSPSRASFLTGRRPERLQVWNNNAPVEGHLGDGVPLQELFEAQGYHTARLGKIFHGRWERAFGWDEAGESASPVTTPRVPHPALGRADEEEDGSRDSSKWWEETDLADADEPDGRRARDAVAILEEPRQQPLFLAIGFAKPHRRWVAPRRYFDLYPPESIRLHGEPADDRDDVPSIALANSPLERPGRYEAGQRSELRPEDERLALRAHNATVSFADAQVGVVLDALDRLHLWDRTIVVLLGDHGYNLDEHGGLWRKDTLFEEALRTPLVIAAPGLREPGVAARGLVEMVDLYPTLADLAGVTPPSGLDGVSLRPLLETPARPWRSAAFGFRATNPPRLARSIRTRDYRFTEWPDGSDQLFDERADPAERHDVAKAPEHARLVAELRERLYAGLTILP